MMARPVPAALLIAAAFLLRGRLEALPLTHVLVQMPALVLAGVLVAPRTGFGQGEWNRGGWACLLVAGFGVAFWMLPRHLDAVVADSGWEAAKFVSLPLGVGLPLAAGWARAHPLLRAVIKAKSLSMLAVLAYLYTHAPVRLCNAYLAEDQYRLGLGFLFLALAAGAAWIVPLLFAPPRPDRAREATS